jgi:hypothetical protein
MMLWFYRKRSTPNPNELPCVILQFTLYQLLWGSPEVDPGVAVLKGVLHEWEKRFSRPISFYYFGRFSFLNKSQHGSRKRKCQQFDPWMNSSFTFVKDTVNYPFNFCTLKTFCLTGETCTSLFDYLLFFVLFYDITSGVFLKEDIDYL